MDGWLSMWTLSLLFVVPDLCRRRINNYYWYDRLSVAAADDDGAAVLG